MAKLTPIQNHIPASTFLGGPFVMAADQAGDYQMLGAIGIHLHAGDVAAMVSAFGMDANVLTPTIAPGTIPTPAQFLQNWLPGLVRTMTVSRVIDELVGISIGGNWEDEEVVQQVLEPTGFAVPYTDLGNVPLASWNPSYERRTIVRFEQGFMVGKLEDARTGRVPNLNTAAEKRAAAALTLEILRNRIGFYGYIGGAGRTFGMLNDPNLPAIANVATNGTTTQWTGKTFLQITADIREALGALQTQSGNNIDPERTPLILAIASSRSQYFTVTSDFGISVRDWLSKTYPNVRVVSVPEFNGANGGANVFYLYAERIEDGSSDGGRTFEQIVPTKLMSLGVEQRVKSYLEDYTNALGGVMLKRPLAVVRRSGI